MSDENYFLRMNISLTTYCMTNFTVSYIFSETVGRVLLLSSASFKYFRITKVENEVRTIIWQLSSISHIVKRRTSLCLIYNKIIIRHHDKNSSLNLQQYEIKYMYCSCRYLFHTYSDQLCKSN